MTPPRGQLRFGLFRAARLLAAGALWLVASSAAMNAAAATDDWQRLPGATQRIAATWRDQQLETVLARVAEASDMPVWIDRRVNRQQLVTLALAETTVANAVQQIAAAAGYEATPWRGVVVVAAPGAADEIETLGLAVREQLVATPAPVRRRWLTPAAATWPQLTEPRALLMQWIEPLGLAANEAARVPHDLLPAASLPALAPIDRATLLLGGFDLTLQFDAGGAPRIAPIARPVRITREYRLRPQTIAAFDAKLAELVAAGLAEAPGGARAEQGRRVSIAASAAGHEQLAAALSGRNAAEPPPAERPPRRSPGAERRFSLRIEGQPLGPVLDQLAAQLGVQFVWGEGLVAAEYRTRRVSCNVRDVTRAELLAAIVADAELACDIAGNTATLRPVQR